MKIQMKNTCLTLQSFNCASTNPVFQKSPKENYPGKESSDSEDTSSIGNTLWCSCGISKPMTTRAESVFCLDKYEIYGSYFNVISFVFEIFYPVIC